MPPRLFGTLVEHMGRCVYGGIFDPGDPRSDAAGLRSDVADLVRELGTSVVRYPGGNFVSGYDWRHGVGPLAERPARLDDAWHSVEPNTFGLNEFMGWAANVGVEPMLAVNLGSLGAAEATELIEYTNGSSDLRASHGRVAPYGVKLWCLGNEMDGPWQIGHKTADEYGRLAAETAKAMRRVDPTIELVVCGSSHDRMPTFGTWETIVLEHAFDEVDYISLHCYFEKTDDDDVGYLASAIGMDAIIEHVVAICDRVAASKGSTRELKLSFDEWNVETRVRDTERPWEFGPRLSEDKYRMEDAVVVGGLLISLLRHSDRVAIACLAQLVNVMAPILAERDTEAWRQPTFLPFALTSRAARGDVLRVEHTTSTAIVSSSRGTIDPLDVIATHDPVDGSIAIFTVNRSATDSIALDAAITAGANYRVVEQGVIGEHVASELSHEMDNSHLLVELPRASWTMVRLEPDGLVS